jgi:hypothetical protein
VIVHSEKVPQPYIWILRECFLFAFLMTYHVLEKESKSWRFFFAWRVCSQVLGMVEGRDRNPILGYCCAKKIAQDMWNPSMMHRQACEINNISFSVSRVCEKKWNHCFISALIFGIS